MSFCLFPCRCNANKAVTSSPFFRCHRALYRTSLQRLHLFLEPFFAVNPCTDVSPHHSTRNSICITTKQLYAPPGTILSVIRRFSSNKESIGFGKRKENLTISLRFSTSYDFPWPYNTNSFHFLPNLRLLHNQPNPRYLPKNISAHCVSRKLPASC